MSVDNLVAVFVNRQEELALLERWWMGRGATLGFVWGRRRIGKTALVAEFARGKQAVVHTAAGRPAATELELLARAAAPVLRDDVRDLLERPFASWGDAFDTLARAARDAPLLLVLDEFPELIDAAPELEGVLRAAWDRLRTRSKLRILLCGSSLRTMEAMQEERAALFGRIGLAMLLEPFRPHEAALLLPGMEPSQQALVWGLVGGIPLYPEWWDETAPVEANLERLICAPGAPLLTAGELALATDLDAGDLARQVVYAISSGSTRHNEIADAVRADPTRVLERLVRLGIVERMVPVTEDPRRTRRRLYRIADNFLAFWLSVVDRHRAAIEQGLGATVLPVLLAELDDHLGGPWEEAMRIHLRRMAVRGDLGEEIVAVGRFWTAAGDPVEIDAAVLAGRQREAVALAEAKWARRVDGAAIAASLARKAPSLPRLADEVAYVVAAREAVEGGDVIAITAREIFAA